MLYIINLYTISETSRGYIFLILPHFAKKLYNSSNVIKLFRAVMQEQNQSSMFSDDHQSSSKICVALRAITVYRQFQKIADKRLYNFCSENRTQKWFNIKIAHNIINKKHESQSPMRNLAKLTIAAAKFLTTCSRSLSS